jgi:hypothetical protein
LEGIIFQYEFSELKDDTCHIPFTPGTGSTFLPRS